MKLFYKLRCYKWLKEVHRAWRNHEISEMHYISMTDAILNSDDYGKISYECAFDYCKQSHKGMQEYLDSIKTKS